MVFKINVRCRCHLAQILSHSVLLSMPVVSYVTLLPCKDYFTHFTSKENTLHVIS